MSVLGPAPVINRGRGPRTATGTAVPIGEAWHPHEQVYMGDGVEMSAGAEIIALYRGSEESLVAHGDEEAVRAAQADPTAFGLLYHRYRQRIYAYMCARTQSADDAADLTQQVFVQALNALPHYRTRGVPFAAWLFRIARNAATDFHRAHAQRPTVAWDDVPEAQHPSDDHDLDSSLLHVEDLSRLRSLLAGLDPHVRDILTLRFAARLSIAEIAAVVGKSEAATQKRLFRTIRTLQEHYHDHS